jgi:hypothetical protein
MNFLWDRAGFVTENGEGFYFKSSVRKSAMLLCRLSGFNFSCNETLEEFELNLIAFGFLSMRPNAG